MRSVISCTASTLDDSTNPWEIVPNPLAPGLAVMAAPDASVTFNRFRPICSRPALFLKVAICIAVSYTHLTLPSNLSKTCPFWFIVMPVAA